MIRSLVVLTEQMLKALREYWRLCGWLVANLLILLTLIGLIYRICVPANPRGNILQTNLGNESAHTGKGVFRTNYSQRKDTKNRGLEGW